MWKRQVESAPPDTRQTHLLARLDQPVPANVGVDALEQLAHRAGLPGQVAGVLAGRPAQHPDRDRELERDASEEHAPVFEDAAHADRIVERDRRRVLAAVRTA